ncbi:hypothetical protein GCM10007913_35660 [Devosia yakushimensis]|uniref:Uncharacterized protein n=1 Tax=Devosia yakushimensis TaxID=470028 RepID=A0ABQ5UKH7_9HYPH|nr:hypothetical protein [Devosia yakushimensis]GLQ11634.1 hypothetical protein GCM10007913_35660 [Devosia yakushimensis]
MRFAAPLLLALLATPAFAQDQTSEPVPTDCTSLFDNLGILNRDAQSEIEDTATGCAISNVYFGSSYSRFAIGKVTLEADDLFGAVAGNTRPAQLKLNIAGVRSSPDIDSPLNTYIMEMQQVPFELNLAYRWDATSGDFHLDDLSMRMPTVGSAVFQAELSEVRDMPAAIEEPTDYARGNVEKLTLTLDNRGLFTAVAAPILLSSLPYEEDPRPLIAAAQKAVIALIDARPEDQIDAPSKAVLARFVNTFPRPDGLYHFEITPIDAPVSLESLVAPTDDMAGLMELLARFNLSAEYKPLTVE